MKPLSILLAIYIAVRADSNADFHQGPVTDIIVLDGQIYSCSQGGIFKGAGDGLQLLARPAIRVTALAALTNRGIDGLLFGGGEPGVFGSVGWLNLQTKEADPVNRIGKDLVYDLAGRSGSHFAVACANGEVRTSVVAKDARVHSTPVHKHTATARAVAFSRDKKWIASSGFDGVIIISSFVKEEAFEPRQLLDHTSGVECLVFSPDSKYIASGSLDSKVRLHGVNGKLIRTYSGLGMADEPVAGRVPSRVLSLAWHDDRLVAGTSKGSLHLLSLTDDTSLRIPRTGTDPIYSLHFGPTDNLLIGGQSRLQVFRLKFPEK